MPNFVNDSGEVTVNSTSEQTVIQGSNDWCLLVAKLEGMAGGDNHLMIGKGSVGMLVEAGDVVPAILIAPGTQVQVKTTHAGNVKWGYSITYFPGNMILSVLAYSVGYLNALACALCPPGTVEDVDQEIRKLGYNKL